MSRLELEFSPQEDRPFQPQIEYSDPSKNPVTVAKMTSNILDRFFDGTVDDWLIKLLSGDTLDLVYSARKGFLSNIESFSRTHMVDLKSFEYFLKKQKTYSSDDPNGEEREAFSRVFIAFGVLPEIAHHKLLPKGYARRGNMGPPFTTTELNERINELGLQIRQIVGGNVNPNEDLIGKPPLLRTYWTFHALANMPERSIEADNISGIKESTLEALAEKYSDPQSW